MKTTTGGRAQRPLPTGPLHPVEHFTYRERRYDVASAWRIVQGWTPQERAARLVQQPLPLSTLDTIMVDTKLAMGPGVDITVPLLVGQFQNHNATVGRLVLDGWHRVYKASRKRLKTLPAFLLTIEETASIEGRV